ncbi:MULTISPECIES: hypothetical protein [unclassified Bradyrhizobium]|uniref:hypothetical protein n=1 Tax=unclassified Bradyrhizobium TaxID=2631580 RepID=UPI0028EAD82B|nr:MULTISPECIES: hypothetical protein [unclassified Bradyrhizobium]
MITSFEVGAVFKIINQATGPLKAIQKQVREMRAEIAKAKAEIAEIGKTGSLAVATDETRALALAWREVGKAAASANRSIGAASKRSIAGPGAAGVAEAQQLATAWERIALASAATRGAIRGARPPGPGGGGGGGGRGAARNRLMHRGGGGVHVSGPGIGVPGGGHVRVGAGMSGVAAATAGMVGYGAFEAAQMEDTVWQLIYHSGQEYNEANRAKFRSVLQEAMQTTGFGLHDIGEAAKQEIRMFQGTPGNGLDVLPEMLKAASIEARVKGESPEESMKALIGLAHMTKQYSPEEIKKLAPAFAFLSTANPGSLGSIEKAAGYAVPILQSSMGIDPIQALLFGTALTRAGATSTKSGTWLREMAIRAMPGTAIFESEKKAEHHDELLKRLGLLDDKEKPTWFTDGKPDLFKLLHLAGTNLDKIPLSERAGVERKLFGAQGSGGLALLTDPAVRQQVEALYGEMNSPGFKNRYAGFLENYNSQVTAQNARNTLQDFNVTMMDIGQHVLPTVNAALKDFRDILDKIRSLLPAPSNGESTVGKRAIEGALAGATTGAVVGAFGGPIGAVGGAAAGGVLGTAAGFMETYGNGVGIDKGGSFTSPGKTGHRAEPKVIVVPPPQPAQVTLQIDGNALASAIVDVMGNQTGFSKQAPAADDAAQFFDGDHNTGN